MSDEPTEEERDLSAKVNIAKVKTGVLKKGLTKEKNQLSAKKKDLLSEDLTPPEELTKFLQADETFEQVLAVAETNVKDIFVRRYVNRSSQPPPPPPPLSNL